MYTRWHNTSVLKHNTVSRLPISPHKLPRDPNTVLHLSVCCPRSTVRDFSQHIEAKSKPRWGSRNLLVFTENPSFISPKFINRVCVCKQTVTDRRRGGGGEGCYTEGGTSGDRSAPHDGGGLCSWVCGVFVRDPMACLTGNNTA